MCGSTRGPGYCYDQDGACGDVFKLARAGSGWILSSLYHFRGGSDGSWPTSGVTIGPDGTLFGTTASGGNGAQCDYGDTPGCHRLSPATSESRLSGIFLPLDGNRAVCLPRLFGPADAFC